jgi:predicted amidohydrolase YtcJ
VVEPRAEFRGHAVQRAGVDQADVDHVAKMRAVFVPIRRELHRDQPVDLYDPIPVESLGGRELGSNEPNGLVFETAFMPIFEKTPGPGPDEQLALIASGQDLYLREGITTAQEGATTKPQYDLFRQAADRRLLKLDVVSLPII